MIVSEIGSSNRGVRAAGLVLVLLAALVGIAPGAAAQQRPASDTLAVADTLIRSAEPPRSPRGAFIRSLVLPGWGQAWVGAPGRGGVYFALESGSLWMMFKSRQRLAEARETEALLRNVGELSETQGLELVRSRRRQVEDWTAVSIFLFFFSAADAFVAAHLADFDERVGVAPGAGGELRIEATVPVGGRR